MSARDLLKRVIRRVGAPLLQDVDSRLDVRLAAVAPPAAPAAIPPPHDPLSLLLTMAARGIAGSGQHQVLLPTEAGKRVSSVKDLKIGFFGNIANNAHNFVRCLRRLGYDAELVIEDGWFDTFVMNRPFWEDVAVESPTYEAALSHEPAWQPPFWIRRVAHDIDLQVRFQNRGSAAEEVQAEYEKAFGLPLALDRALLLAQHMGHWPYLLAMARYDVVQLSGAPISMAAFAPRPTVVFPTGSDLWISPFEESLFGLLVRAGYRGAGQVLACEPAYAGHLERLQRQSWSSAPMMIDTDRYAPGDGAGVREQWMAQSGGSRFLLAACRQTWRWKGNDRLLRGFAQFVRAGNDQWRLVLQAWGEDVEKSKALAAELGIERLIIWEPLCSKPTLRLKQQAADAAADQFVVAGGYGTSVLEAMAAAKPVLIMPPPAETVAHLPEPPPFVGASDPASIAHALETVANDSARERLGREHLRWLRAVHGYQSVAPRYLAAYGTVTGLRQ